MNTFIRILNYTKCLWSKYNPFDLNDEFIGINEHLINVYNKVVGIENAIIIELETYKQERLYYHNLVEAIGDVSPDMLWAKNLDGKYIYANNAIKNGLLLDHDPIGKDDVTLALAAKERFGEENHTFGELCADSDTITLTALKECSFWEYGKVKGSDLHLLVKKKPLYVDGELYGTVGSGRDITDLVILSNTVNNNCSTYTSFFDILEKYKF
jgi:PAS domain-containing protein